MPPQGYVPSVIVAVIYIHGHSTNLYTPYATYEQKDPKLFSKLKSYSEALRILVETV